MTVREHDVEDQILIQSHRPGSAEAAELRAANASREFPILLEKLRSVRGWTKADLAKRSGLDSSSITRFEQGSREPARETVLQLADAMALPVTDRDRLLAAAGFRSEVWDDPMLIQLAQAMNDERLPETIRDQVRSVIQMAIAYCQQAQEEQPR